MKSLKAYIIDPHVLVRQTISSIIREESGIHVSGCSNGEDENEAMKSIHTISPDVVLFGIDEPGSSQEKLFLELRKRFPLLPVIVMTPLNKKGAGIALNCLKKGAVEFITKPERSCCLTLSANHFKKRVIPAIQMVPRLNMDAIQGRVFTRQNSSEAADSDASHSPSSYYNELNKAEIVVLGGCTGGIQTLYKLISSLPSSFPVPVVVAQHMPKTYSENLSGELDRYSALKVREAKNHSSLVPGYVYIAPGGYHTIVKNNGKSRTISLYRGPKVHRSRPSIDVLFWSAAQTYRNKSVGVLLSGEGKDGAEGARHITQAGGEVITESRKSALLWDLPGYVEQTNISKGSYPADKLDREIIRKIYSGKSLHTLMVENRRKTSNPEPGTNLYI